MNLFAGKIIHVDLSTGQIKTEPLRMDWAREYWGNYGLATRYYWDQVHPSVEPFAPENALVIMPGTFTGTSVPMTGRTTMASKSPHTGTIFNTNIGGHFGPELKFAGYDGIVITGQASAPVYLKIVDDQISLESAADLAGKGIFETEERLIDAVGDLDAKCLVIGPAGENKVSYAIIGSDCYRQMGRGGGGALFGSKNLKGIVCRGTGGVKVADAKSFVDKCLHYKKTNLRGELNDWLIEDGTPGTIDMVNEIGLLPTNNWNEGTSELVDGIGGAGYKPLTTGSRGCAACPMACGKYTRKGDAKMEGPEYETLALCGSNCGVFNMESVIRFNTLCDDLGLDTMSCGNSVSLGMEITASGKGDLGLQFGDEQYYAVVEEIALLSSDRGRDLAGGAKALAAKYDAADMSMEIKGLELPAYDPRANYGMGIGYTTSERGACHLRAFTVFTETPFEIAPLVDEVLTMQNLESIKWSLGFCQFYATMDYEILADLLSAGLGEEVTAVELEKAGERIWNLNRLFNVANGFNAKDDSLPEKVMKKQLKKAGPAEGRTFSAEEFEAAKQLYYQKRGWDANGIPTADKVAELELQAFTV